MTFTTTINKEQIDKVISMYNEYNQKSLYTNYTLFCAKIKFCTLTIYKTGKLLLQGNNIIDVQNEIVSSLKLKDQLLKKADKENINIGKNIIGTDEVGTGDYFGGIAVCCSMVPKDKILELKKMGVKDSKLLSDNKILELGKYLIENIKHTILYLNNKKYNEIISDSINLNKIKAILHNKVIINFLEKYPDISYDDIIIDAFCKSEKYEEYLSNHSKVIKSVKLVEKGESKYMSIAVSSIIARYYFLMKLKELSKNCGYELLKGASSKVDDLAKKIVKEKGIDFLNNIAKVNFKNTTKIMEDNNE